MKVLTMIVCGLALLLTACTTTTPTASDREYGPPRGQVKEATVNTLARGAAWTSADNVTFTVSWAAKGPDVALKEATGVAGRPYVEVTVTVANGSTGPVKGVMTQVSFDGSGATVEFTGPQGTIPDVLPGKSGTLIESFVPGNEIQVQVMTYPMTLHEAYWTGSV